jgi:hypothetical protein
MEFHVTFHMLMLRHGFVELIDWIGTDFWNLRRRQTVLGVLSGCLNGIVDVLFFHKLAA